MTVFITAVRLSPDNSNRHQHITHLKWRQGADIGTFSRSGLVDWIRSGNSAYVDASPRRVEILVVEDNPPYVRTAADGFYTNNLISLPRF